MTATQRALRAAAFLASAAISTTAALWALWAIGKAVGM